jgi:hypothetical protein
MMFFLFVAVTFGLLALLVLDIIIAAPLVVLGLAIVIFIENDIGYWSLFFMLWSLILLIILRTENRISDFLKSIFKNKD